jgi:hypothetical protein
MTAREIEAAYQGAASASRELAVTVQTVYRWLQLGRLNGLCVDGSWLVERASVERMKESRGQEAQTLAPTAA